jgi:hypothetical protein
VSDDGAARLWDLPVDRGSLDDGRAIAGCSPFVLADGVLTANRAPRTPCPRPPR